MPIILLQSFAIFQYYLGRREKYSFTPFRSHRSKLVSQMTWDGINQDFIILMN